MLPPPLGPPAPTTTSRRHCIPHPTPPHPDARDTNEEWQGPGCLPLAWGAHPESEADQTTGQKSKDTQPSEKSLKTIISEVIEERK